MGFFSWKTSDTNESIPNVWADDRQTFPVKMLDDQGNEWVENEYDGYGVFGGKDYYELIGEMPDGCDGSDSDRMEENISRDPDAKKPKFVRVECTKRWGELPDSPSCPDQGFFYNF